VDAGGEGAPMSGAAAARAAGSMARRATPWTGLGLRLERRSVAGVRRVGVGVGVGGARHAATRTRWTRTASPRSKPPSSSPTTPRAAGCTRAHAHAHAHAYTMHCSASRDRRSNARLSPVAHSDRAIQYHIRPHEEIRRRRELNSARRRRL
jgi:hypothetical protein